MSIEKDSVISRRDFLARTGTVMGGLLIAFHVPRFLRSGAYAAEAAAKPVYPPNAFLHIAPDNTITLQVNRIEFGQGVHTSFSQLISEELGCSLNQMNAVTSNADSVYNTPGMPFIITGGSMSIRTSYDQYRKIGAGMREMLKQAAAKRWNVLASEIKVENAHLIHGQQKLSFGEVADEASAFPFPDSPLLKHAKEFKIIGKSSPRLDAKSKSTGKATFGMDVRLPGMLYAAIAKPPFENSKLSHFDEGAAKKIPGVVEVVQFGEKVGVLAKNTYAALQGKAALGAKWNSGANSNADTSTFMAQFKKLADQTGVLVEERGSAGDGLAKAKKTITCEFEFPFLCHASMEPINCTVNFDGKQAEIYGGFQMPTQDVQAAAKTLGIPVDKIKVNVTYAGGSFGRRACKTQDWVVEACALAKEVKKPFKMVWSREDDMRAGYYRPMNYHRARLGFDENNNLVGWDHAIVGQSIMRGSFMEAMIKNGIDETVVEGVKGTKYSLKNFRVQQTLADTPLTSLWWRSVGNSHTAYVMETLIDEVAEKMKRDELSLRKEWLASSPRHIAVLEQLQKDCGWGHTQPPKERAWGIAIHESFESVVGQIAEVSVENGMPKVHRVWAAAHVGQTVNPDGVKTQIEGAVVFGLSAILHQEITLKNGEVEQSNYNTYPVLRMHDTPSVHVSIVPSNAPPTGIGEPGVPPIGPAVANAFYKLTKKRVRVLPFAKGPIV